MDQPTNQQTDTSVHYISNSSSKRQYYTLYYVSTKTDYLRKKMVTQKIFLKGTGHFFDT